MEAACDRDFIAPGWYIRSSQDLWNQSLKSLFVYFHFAIPMVTKAITNFLQPLIRIRHEEWGKALLMFAYFFLTITSYYIIKPVRNSLFIEAFGAVNLPYVWLITIFALGVFVSIYVRFVDYLEKNVLLMSTIAFFCLSFVGFWLLLRLKMPIISGVLFVWVSIFSVTMVTQFWLFANDLFNPREAKRLYGFVGSGGILGGIIGGTIANQMARVVGTENLILIAACILPLCIVIVSVLWKLEKEKIPTDRKAISPDEIGAREGVKLLGRILKTRYLLLLLCLVCFAKGVSTIVDFQFNNVVEMFYTVTDARTAFFGKFFAWLNGFSFCVQFFLTSRILRHYGVTAALLILPIGLMFGSIAILANPALWSAVYTMMYDGGLNYSLNTSTKEVLYLPIARELRYRIKPFIDMFAYRFSKAAASIAILLFTRVFHLSISMLSIIPITIIGVWLVVIVLMKKEYIRLLRGFLKREKSGETIEEIPCSDVYLTSSVLQALHPNNHKELAFSLRLVNLCSDKTFRAELRKLDFAQPDAKRILENIIDIQPRQKFTDEIETILRRENITELSEVIDFMSACCSSESSQLPGRFFQSPFPQVRLSSACASFLRVSTYSAEELAKVRVSAEELFRKKSLDDLVFVSLKKRVGRGKIDLINGIKKYVLDCKPLEGEAMIVELRSDTGHTVEILGYLFNNDDLSLEAKKRVLRLFSFIPHTKTVDFLVDALANRRNTLRRDILLVLRDIRVASPTINFKEEKIKNEIRSEIREYEDTLDIITLNDSLMSGKSSTSYEDGFRKAQEEHSREVLEKIFLLLGLLSGPADMHAVYQGLRSGKDHIRAQALELLDNVLEPNLRTSISAIFESETLESGQASPALSGIRNSGKPIKNIKLLLEKENRWCMLSGLYLVLDNKLNDLYSDLYVAKRFHDPFVQKFGELVENRIGNTVKFHT